MNEHRRNLWLTILGVMLLCGMVLAVYWPARHGGFIFDDDVLLTDNPLVKSPTGWYRIWTTDAVDFWPITNDALWLQWRLWGLDPTGYHVVNVLLQIVDSLLIWLVLRRLQIPGAYLAALLFAVHPVNVESVAWIAQLKNVLSLLFFLLSILWYLKEDKGFNRWYALSLASFILAGLSKGSVLILPLVLLLIAWWQRGRIDKTDVVRTAPFFLVAAVLTAVNIWFQTHGSSGFIRDVTFGQRLAGAGAVVWFYLAKALAPIHLSFVYLQWEIQTSELRWWLPLAATLLVTAVLVWQSYASKARWIRSLLFAWGFFCVALLPVMGFTDVGFMKFSLVADHYQQIALIAVLAFIVGGGTSLVRRWSQHVPSMEWAGSLAAATIVAFFAFLTFKQTELYADPIVLYETTLKMNPNCWMVESDLGLALSDAGKFEEAIGHFKRALEANNRCAQAHCNWAAALIKIGQPNAAIDHFQQAIAINPDDPQTHAKLGDLLAADGQTQAAYSHYEKALQLHPNDADCHYNLGLILAAEHQLPAAIDHFLEASQLDASNIDTQQHLGIALAMADRLPEALTTFEQIVRSHPNNIEGNFNLAMAYARLDRQADALTTARRALELARSQSETGLAGQIEAWLKSIDSTERPSSNGKTTP